MASRRQQHRLPSGRAHEQANQSDHRADDQATRSTTKRTNKRTRSTSKQTNKRTVSMKLSYRLCRSLRSLSFLSPFSFLSLSFFSPFFLLSLWTLLHIVTLIFCILSSERKVWLRPTKTSPLCAETFRRCCNGTSCVCRPLLVGCCV